MAGPRPKRMNIPLRRVIYACAAVYFTLLAHLSHIQAFRADALREDPRNPRHRLSGPPHVPFRLLGQVEE